MEKVLIVLSKYHLNLYKNGFLDYGKRKDIKIDFWLLYDREIESFYNKKAYKYNFFGRRDFINKKQYEKLKQIINNYNKCLFINLSDESRLLIKAIPQKIEKYLLFVDTIKDMNSVDELYKFEKIFSFEYRDVEYAKQTLKIKVNYVPIGTSYYLYSVVDGLPKYDISFVCLATKKRLEYLDKIANYCQENGRTLFVAGHFWHNSNFLQRKIGEFKFRKRYPVLYKYVKNEYLKPYELAQVYVNSKICLNINIEKHHSFNTRNFDVMILERMLITDDEDLNGIDLIPGQEFIMSRNEDDMVRNIDIYLNNDEERLKIARKGKQKVGERYCFINAIEQIFG